MTAIYNNSSRLEVFFKKYVLENFAKIHRKTPVLETVFNTVAVYKPPRQNFSCFSPWDWSQIGIKLETKHGVHQKLANFM